MPIDHEALLATLHEASVYCVLCGYAMWMSEAAVIWIAHRWNHEGYVLVARPEWWCPACARLALGLEAVRHVSLPKGKG